MGWISIALTQLIVEMALLNNPVRMDILRENGRRQLLDVIPIYEEHRPIFVATDALRIYKGLPLGDVNNAKGDIQRDRYLKYIEWYGADNPLFLGELHIIGSSLPDWRYHGDKLTENEIWQIVALLIELKDDFA